MKTIEVQMGGRRTTGPVVPVSADFEEVYVSERRGLVALALSLTGDRAVAEDLTQEAFLRLYQHWSRVGLYERPGAWARRVLLRMATSRARRLAAEARALARLGHDRRWAPVLSSEAVEFWAAVRALPRRQAQTLALYYAEDHSVAEIAEILGCTEGTVRAHLHQGRQTLRAHFGTIDGQQEDSK